MQERVTTNTQQCQHFEIQQCKRFTSSVKLEKPFQQPLKTLHFNYFCYLIVNLAIKYTMLLYPVKSIKKKKVDCKPHLRLASWLSTRRYQLMPYAGCLAIYGETRLVVSLHSDQYSSIIYLYSYSPWENSNHTQGIFNEILAGRY